MNTNINLGQLIPSGAARKAIWTSWLFLTLAVGAIPVAFSALDQPNPSWLVAVWAVIVYLNIPLSTLAQVNTPTTHPAGLLTVETTENSTLTVSEVDHVEADQIANQESR